jgi:hypothetical protein
MLQTEFEERVGFKITSQEYGIIETLYNDSDLDKDIFCAKWKKNDRMEMSELNANTISILNKRIFANEENAKKHSKVITDTAHFLINKSIELGDYELYSQAIDLIGLKDVIRYKLENGLSLTKDESVYIINKL